MTDDATTAIAPRPLVFLDVETTGLDPDRHEVWQAAYAFETGPVRHHILSHTLFRADPVALTVNGYLDAVDHEPVPMTTPTMIEFEHQLYSALDGATIVAANPSFDIAMLRARWGKTPWHYRTIDIESYAMPMLALDRPPSLITIVQRLRMAGYDITEPEHTAHSDVTALRECWHALQESYALEDDPEPLRTEATGAPSS